MERKGGWAPAERVGSGVGVHKERLSGANPESLSKEPGDDLLFHRYGSTIGAAVLNFSVRNGKRWFHCAIVTRMFSDRSRRQLGAGVKVRMSDMMNVA